MIELRREGEPVAAIMARRGDAVLQRLRAAMAIVEREGKAQLRGIIATRLTQRAAYLLTSKTYEDGLVVYFHSRWWRRGVGEPKDVLAAHRGVTIRAVRAGGLIVSSARGRWARARVRRELAAGGGGAWRLQWVSGRGGTLVALARPRGGGPTRVIATLARQIALPARLDHDRMRAEVARIAQRVLGARS